MEVSSAAPNCGSATSVDITIDWIAPRTVKVTPMLTRLGQIWPQPGVPAGSWVMKR